MKLYQKIKQRKQLLSKEMDFEMLNYLLDNVKNWYELPMEKEYEIH